MAASPDEPRMLTELSGTVLEQRYEIGRVLGAGGMGAVFEGRHLRLDRPVAIKVLRPGFAGHDEYVARFLREAKAASKIRHRNVVEILDYGEASGGLVYSVMELLAGQDLEQLLRAQPEERLPWARACDLLVQIASGLKAAHGRGVIHRDIKPANCFLTDEDGEPVVKLVDFGIAKLDEADQATQLTATAQVLGTPSYIAPELVRTKNPASPRSDIYALGVLAYRMLTGSVPFAADTVFELLRRACFDPVPPLRDHVPDLPPAVEAFVLELLAKEPDDRPADVLTVRQRLLALSRETLGAQVVEIPVSSALPLDAESSGPTGSDESTTRPRDVMRGGTAVHLEGERGKRSSEASTEVLVAAESPLPAIHERSAAHSRSGETMPLVSETSPHLDTSASIEPHRPRRMRWGAVAGAAALVVIGGIAVFVLDGGRSPGAVEGSAAVAGLAADGSELGAGSPLAVTPNSGEDEEPELVVSPPGEDDAPRPEPSKVASVDIDLTAAAPAEPSPPNVIGDAEDELSQPAAEELAASGPKPVVPITPADHAKKQRTSARASKLAAPPSDVSRIAELKELILKNCARPLIGTSVQVSFTVTTVGEVQDVSASPSNAAGYCAAGQVKGIAFRPRPANVPKRITVP